jgi:hypothetical protein
VLRELENRNIAAGNFNSETGIEDQRSPERVVVVPMPDNALCRQLPDIIWKIQVDGNLQVMHNRWWTG